MNRKFCLNPWLKNEEFALDWFECVRIELYSLFNAMFNSIKLVVNLFTVGKWNHCQGGNIVNLLYLIVTYHSNARLSYHQFDYRTNSVLWLLGVKKRNNCEYHNDMHHSGGWVTISLNRCSLITVFFNFGNEKPNIRL